MVLVVLAFLLAKWHERFYDAAFAGDEEKALRILRRRPKLAHQPHALVVAAQVGSEPLLRALVDLGADVNGANRQNVTPLSAAAPHPELVALLIARGAAPDRGGWALHHAAIDGTLESIRLLIEHGADVNAEDRAFGTPVLSAAAAGQRDAVALLLDLGGSPAVLDENGRLPRWKGPAIDPEVKASIEAMLRPK